MSDHASAASTSAKSRLSLPGPCAHASSTETFFFSASSVASVRIRSSAASIAARALRMASAGYSAGVARRSSVKPTANASSRGVGATPLADKKAPFDADVASAKPGIFRDFPNRDFPMSSPPRRFLLTLGCLYDGSFTNCSGAPYVGSKMVSDGSQLTSLT